MPAINLIDIQRDIMSIKLIEYWERYVASLIMLIIRDLGEGSDTLPTKLISKGFWLIAD